MLLLNCEMINISKRASGSCEINKLLKKYNNMNSSNEIKYFADMPLSLKTLRGLAHLNYIYPTAIQRESIVVSLQGKDVVGCAVTGSGKTLAFLIPVLERLYVKKWSNVDGIGAIIISPTRELSYQIFETLKKVGKYHGFSAGLIIGGKNLNFEKKRMDRCNILICTPGRLLQHMDENPLFSGLNIQILVLDEADRCLDMGFEKVINAIIENIQPERQTLLFSATQTQSLRDLMRLNLNNSVYVGPKDLDKVVPVLLQQNYVVVALKDKITMLWSFINNHLKQKCIVFLSSCKQVKYIYEIFCKLRPGTSLLALYGTLHQDRRITIYNEFVNKRNVFLFATDIASRGLDFPSIDWVIQLDCPENLAQYVHRAGRSARNKARGESLLVLMPSEEHTMVDELKKNSISIKQIHIDTKKLFSPLAKIEAFLAQNPNLKASAKRAFTGYIKSVYNMKNKRIFDVRNVNFDDFAKSLGLVITPRIRFIDNKLKNIVEKKQPAIENNQLKIESNSNELLTIKNTNNIECKLESMKNFETNFKTGNQVTKAAQVKKCLKKKILKTTIKYNDDGNAIEDNKKDMFLSLSNKCSDINFIGGINIEISKQLICEKDKFDKQKFMETIKKKQRRTKNKYQKTFKNDFNGACYYYNQLSCESNLDKKHKEICKTSRKRDDVCTPVNKISYPNRRKVSTQLSLKDAETIATEILF